MNVQSDYKYDLLSRVSAFQCRACPPSRVCAWDCAQGANVADIVVKASLATSRAAATDEPGQSAARQGLWNRYNRVRRR